MSVGKVKRAFPVVLDVSRDANVKEPGVASGRAMKGRDA